MAERDDDDRGGDRPRRKGPPDNTKVPCPKCGSRSVRKGPWPWYLGTLGAILCHAVICNECGHEYDTKKPQAHLPTRKRNLAIVINLIGFVGILAVLGLLGYWIMIVMNPR
jgi:DNA-directed RNA polymerase subunit RPC12/RpoP